MKLRANGADGTKQSRMETVFAALSDSHLQCQRFIGLRKK